MDAAVPADVGSTRGRQSGGQAVGPAAGEAGEVKAEWEAGGDQDLAGASGLEGLHCPITGVDRATLYHFIRS